MHHAPAVNKNYVLKKKNDGKQNKIAGNLSDIRIPVRSHVCIYTSLYTENAFLQMHTQHTQQNLTQLQIN